MMPTPISRPATSMARSLQVCRSLGQRPISCGMPSDLQRGERLPDVPGIVHGVRRNYFDERIAKGYDARWANLSEPAVVDPAVSFLAGLAGQGGALELGIGTGRLALPLSQRGVRVHGIELSPPMVAQLQARPGAEDIGVTIGDFATSRVG